jgi:transketolase
LKACEELKQEGTRVRVIDLYSIKPIDDAALKQAADETGRIITIEDHFAQGGLGEAVMCALADLPASIHSLAVRKMPRSGKPDELLDYEGISCAAIVRTVKDMLGNTKRKK